MEGRTPGKPALIYTDILRRDPDWGKGHEILKSYINLVIKRGIYLNSRRPFPKPVCGFLPVDVRPPDIILAKQTTPSMPVHRHLTFNQI